MSSTQTQPTPLIAITVKDGDVTINGAAIDLAGQDPHTAAVHAVARQIAQPLGRPVRAVATDHTGRSSLTIHPDGHASDFTTITDDDLEALYAQTMATEHTDGPGPMDNPIGSTPLPPAISAEDQVAPAPATRAQARAAQDGRSFLTVHEDTRPAETGWRGFLARLGIRTEPSPAEQTHRAALRTVSGHWPGPRTIAVVNGKGGANKTPSAALLAAVFARNGGSGVLAWDNNETRGTLGWRTEQGPHEQHVLGLLPHAESLMQPTARAADLAAYVHHQVQDKYDVLRSNPLLLPHQQRLTAADFDAVHQVAAKYFRLIFIDSGNDETAPHWLRMIDYADQLVVATTTRPDHAEAGRLLLDALRDRNEHSAALAQSAVVIVSQADREEASAATIAAGYEGLARQALTIPYDPAMRAPWLRYDALTAATQRAYLAAAAAVADGL